MRTAVTSVGAALDDIERGVHVGSVWAGAITTLPVLCFAGLGALTPRLARRVSADRLLVFALVAMTAGLLLRATVSSIWLFVPLSLIALAGGAVSNVLMPSLVKEHFPDAVGRMTAVYTTALAIGLTAGAGLTDPIGSLGGGWRTGIGAWALLSAVAVLPWLSTVRANEPSVDAGEPILPIGALRHSATARALTVFFAFQSFQAYIAFGWFPDFLHDHGVSTPTAGWMLAVLAAMSIPVSMVVPNVAPKRQVVVITVLSACYLAAYVGLAVAPVGGAWVWMVLAGIGSGSFPIALTLIGFRARTAATTVALSAFTQSIGYVVAGSGPLLFGVLHAVTGGWALPMVLMFVALALSYGAAVRACRDRYVDDELRADPVTTGVHR